MCYIDTSSSTARIIDSSKCQDVFRLMGRVSLKNAAAVTDDYFSALLTLGRRARIQRDESFLVNAKHSRSALAAIDLAVRVFGAKVLHGAFTFRVFVFASIIF